MTEEQFLDAIADALLRGDQPINALTQIRAALSCRLAVIHHTDHAPLFAEIS